MNISKGEVSEFQYSSAMPIAKEDIVTALGTANNSTTKIVRITDFKAAVATAVTVKLSGEGGSYQALQFKIPANGLIDFHWEIPYTLGAVSSTGETRSIVASASGTGVRYSVSGFYEK